MGFDFYAPQTFEDAKERRILIGWAGIPDAEYDNEPTIAMGWQHALTFPGELTMDNGRILQNPVEEIKKLRNSRQEIPEREAKEAPQSVFELTAAQPSGTVQSVEITCGNEFVRMEYQNQVFSLSISKEAGRGRTVRKMQLEQLSELRIFADTSLLEVFVNGGAAVFTSRFYFPNSKRTVKIKGMNENYLWSLDQMEGL